MDQLICDASVIVLPAHVEGFGFGLMHALAACKPIVTRGIPATEEILKTLRHVSGVFLFSNDAELVAATREALIAERSSATYHEAVKWSDWADGVGELCLRLCKAEDLFPRLVRRIQAGDLMRHAASASQNGGLLSDSQAHVGGVPDATATTKRRLSLKQLMMLDGREFVEAAYRTLLCREADQSGLAFYVSEVEGGIDKREVLRALATSPEGRAKATQIDGLSELLGPPRSLARKSLLARLLGN